MLLACVSFVGGLGLARLSITSGLTFDVCLGCLFDAGWTYKYSIGMRKLQKERRENDERHTLLEYYSVRLRSSPLRETAVLAPSSTQA